MSNISVGYSILPLHNSGMIRRNHLLSPHHMHVSELKKRYKKLHDRLDRDQIYSFIPYHYGTRYRERTLSERTNESSIYSSSTKTQNGCVSPSASHQKEKRRSAAVQQRYVPRYVSIAENIKRQFARSAELHRKPSRIKHYPLLEGILGESIFYINKLNVQKHK